MTTEIEDIIERSLEQFLSYVRENDWFGRENEAVSLYAFGFLLRECKSAGPLIDPTQIGIEVGAAPAPTKGPNACVRKDLVIWPQPEMNYWFPRSKSLNKPLAVIEWKVRRPNTQTPRGKQHDLDWLEAHTSADFGCIGYSVELNLDSKPSSLGVIRFFQGLPSVVDFN